MRHNCLERKRPTGRALERWGCRMLDCESQEAWCNAESKPLANLTFQGSYQLVFPHTPNPHTDGNAETQTARCTSLEKRMTYGPYRLCAETQRRANAGPTHFQRKPDRYPTQVMGGRKAHSQDTLSEQQDEPPTRHFINFTWSEARRIMQLDCSRPL